MGDDHLFQGRDLNRVARDYETTVKVIVGIGIVAAFVGFMYVFIDALLDYLTKAPY